ncbi:MAG: hypothetical protein WCP16_09745 [Pseudanabaena sp. ELA645]|jgi:hypothetical protein
MFSRWLKNFFNWIRALFAGKKSGSASPLPSIHGAPSPGTSVKIDIPVQTSEVTIIGPQSCGKTTYLGAIFACPNRSAVVKTVSTLGDYTKAFALQANNILSQGGFFLASILFASRTDIKQVRFSITFDTNDENPITLSVFSTDYSGELIDRFGFISEETKNMYMEDCVRSQGILFLVSAQESRKDAEYAIVVQEFFEELVASRMDGWAGQIAFGLTKCEDIYIYTQRRELGSQGLIEKYFPLTLQALKMACYNQNIDIGYFSMSAFGMRANQLEANVAVKVHPVDPNCSEACLRYPRLWKPFGLFAPLYWLGTGKRFPDGFED